MDPAQVFASPWFYIPGLSVAVPMLMLYVKGYIPNREERKFLIAEMARKDQMIGEQAEYIKKLVSEQQMQNDAIRKDVIPAMANVMQQILLLSRDQRNG